MSFLAEIINNKRRIVEKQKTHISIPELEKAPREERMAASLVASLANSESGIIAEFKRKSPSKGWFKPIQFPIVPTINEYENGGAAGVSVLTDEDYFGGSLEDLVRAKHYLQIPVLRKDFIIDRWQITESRQAGADVILLIAACLTPGKVKELARYAKSLGLEILLEIHDEEELEHICDEVDLVGVNNRNLETFKVDLDTSFRLIDKIKGKPAVAESGIHDLKTILELKKAGFSGFLIGEKFMRENEPGEAFKNFIEGRSEK